MVLKLSHYMEEAATIFLGNEKIRAQLAKQASRARLSGERLSGAYVFAGPVYSGKAQAAEWYAAALLCQAGRVGEPCGLCPACRQVKSGSHPDLSRLKCPDDKKDISVAAVRQLITRLAQGSFLGGYQLAIIENAQLLNAEGANALLKTLEEPSGRSLIILLADEPELIIKTILSRSQLFIFYPAAEMVLIKYLVDNFGLPRREAAIIARLSGRRPRLARLLAQQPEFLADKIKCARVLLDNLSTPTAAADAIASLVPAAAGQEAARAARNVLANWQTMARDWLLAAAGAPELIVNQPLAREINERRWSTERVLAIQQLIKNGQRQLLANVNPRLVLENILYNLYVEI